MISHSNLTFKSVDKILGCCKFKMNAFGRTLADYHLFPRMFLDNFYVCEFFLHNFHFIVKGAV